MRIRIEFQGPGFVAVPNHVAAMVPGKLSAEALGVLVRLALLPVGSDWNVSTVLTKCGLGRRAWERVSRELRAVGALFDDAPRGADGTLRGRVLSVRWPAPPVRSARAKKPVTEQHVLSVSDAQKPKRTKRAFRSSQPVELIEEKPVECAKPAVPLKTKTGEAVAVAPTGGKAAAASPVDPSSLTRFQRSQVLAGQSVLVAGSVIRPDAPEGLALALALRAAFAEN